MRLAEADIVAGLRHSNLHVREVVVAYLEDCGRTQADITRHLVEAVNQFGWDEVLEFPNRLASFELDAATLDWALGEIGRTGSGAPSENMRWHLSRMIADAPIEVVRPALDRILQLDIFHRPRHKLSRQRWTNADQLKLRNGLFDKTPEECWELLDRHCREVAQVDETTDADALRATALVERIATASDVFAGRVQALLEREDVANGYEEWQTGAMIELAGLLRLEPAAELIFRQFDKDWDWYNEAIQKALVRIGTPAVTALVRDHYRTSPWYVRLFSGGVFAAVHHDGSVDDVLQVLQYENHEEQRGRLGIALASHFDERGVEPALEIYREDRKDIDRFEIIERVFAHTSLANIDRPEMAEWEETIDERWRVFKKNQAELERSIGSLLEDEDLDDDLDDDEWADIASNNARLDDKGLTLPKLQPVVRTAPRVGRNERCPCGSGKKYKQCCMRKPK